MARKRFALAPYVGQYISLTAQSKKVIPLEHKDVLVLEDIVVNRIADKQDSYPNPTFDHMYVTLRKEDRYTAMSSAKVQISGYVQRYEKKNGACNYNVEVTSMNQLKKRKRYRKNPELLKKLSHEIKTQWPEPGGGCDEAS